MPRQTIAALTAVLLLVEMSPSTVAGGDDEWKIKWKNGFRVESPDKQHQFKFGGRVQADWTFVADQDDPNTAFYGAIDDANEFRRARLFFEGTMYKRIKFKAQYDFAGGDAEFKDVWIEFAKTPIGHVRVGHFKEPFSLEELTSSKYIAFLERSTNNIFSPSRNTGIMVHDSHGDRINWGVGAFRESDDFGDTSDASRGKLNLTGRVAGRPWYEDDGKKLAHVGLSVSLKDMGADMFRFRSRPEIHVGPRFVDTGEFVADEVLIYDLEGAVIVNRFWASGEYMMADADAVTFSTDDPSFEGHYVQVGFFLTDDHKAYKTSGGVFDRVKPSKNFGDGGCGAWEIALRYGKTDLSEAFLNDPEGGEIEDITLGVNWYPNPATRVMLNYIMAESDITGIDTGSADFVTVRVQVDF